MGAIALALCLVLFGVVVGYLLAATAIRPITAAVPPPAPQRCAAPVRHRPVPRAGGPALHRRQLHGVLHRPLRAALRTR